MITLKRQRPGLTLKHKHATQSERAQKCAESDAESEPLAKVRSHRLPNTENKQTKQREKQKQKRRITSGRRHNSVTQVVTV